MKKFFKIFEWIIFIIILTCLLMVASPLLPTKQYLASYVVSTNSMYPSINAGSLVIIKGINVNEINKGSVIAFTNPNNLKQTIIHRVVDIKENDQGELTYTTKGDNNEVADLWTISPALVKGKVLIYIPKLGIVVDYIKTFHGFVTFFVIPALILGILQIKKIKEGINEEIERRTKEAIRERENATKTILGIVNFVAIISQIVFIPKAYALFSSSVTITGITLETAGLVNIDIKPGSDDNPINLKSEGTVPVAIMGSDSFNIKGLDVDTVVFAGADAEKWNYEDINEDGNKDLVLHFNIEDLKELNKSSTTGILTCKNKEGEEFFGSDAVKIIHEEKKEDKKTELESL